MPLPLRRRLAPTPSLCGATIGRADSVVVLDFETSGLSPDNGDRVIEVGAVRIEAGRIAERFTRLINPGFQVSPFIESYTGITNEMLAGAAVAREVFGEFADFLRDHNLVAHNASFDRRFLDAEFSRLGHIYAGEFACSMLIARRLYQHVDNHRLATLVHHTRIATDGVFHRALADSEMTAKLWLRMIDEIRERYNIESLSFTQAAELARVNKRAVASYFSNLSRERGSS